MGLHAVRVAVVVVVVVVVVVGGGGGGGGGHGEGKKGGESVSGRNAPASWGTKPTRFPSSP